MKKLTLGFMAFALAATTLFSTSCKDDDDDKISTLSATTINGDKFSTSAAAFYSSNNQTNTGTSKLASIFGSTDGSTTIAGGTKDGKQLAINIKGIDSGTYKLDVGVDTDVNKALINLLSGGTAEDIIKDAVNFNTDAMIIYRESNAKEGEAGYWFSTKASVTFNLLAVYATGSFTATMRNSEGKTFEITDGSFKVFGKPVTTAK